MSRIRHKHSGGKVAGEAPRHYAHGGAAPKHHEHGEGEHPKLRADKRARGGTTKFRTPSGSVSSHGREEAEKHHEAMPGGRFPIRNRADLMNAKHAIGRAKGDKGAVRAWINKRAKALGAPPLGGGKKS